MMPAPVLINTSAKRTGLSEPRFHFRQGRATSADASNMYVTRT